MSDHRCYLVGPTLPADERPWPTMWEQEPDECEEAHDWELVLLAADGQHRVRIEEVVRCRDCHKPRCGHSIDADPCILVRHHPGDHLLCATTARFPSRFTASGRIGAALGEEG